MAGLFRILVVDHSRQYCKTIKNTLSKLELIREIEFAFDGHEAIEQYRAFQPDMLIIEPLLPKGDGFELLESIAEDKLFRIVTTFVSHEFIIKKSLDLGADYIFIKPLDEDLFAKRLLEIISRQKEPESSAPRAHRVASIADFLKSVGIPVNIMGFRYLKSAIELVANDLSNMDGVTKRLYLQVAGFYNSTPSRVERNIRHAIEVAYNRGNPKLLNDIFGYTIDEDKGKPTNSEFIAMIADKVQIGMNKVD